MEKFLIDIHVHTSEVSGCGQVKAEDAVKMYHSAGYQGLMITDHFHKQYFDGLKLESWEKKIDRYLEGYHKAQKEGQRLGMEILLGMEFRNCETDNDFLIIGVTEDFLYTHPDLYELPLTKAIDLFHQWNVSDPGTSCSLSDCRNERWEIVYQIQDGRDVGYAGSSSGHGGDSV